MIYAGRVLLRCGTDEEVWNLTPRYLFSQLNVHYYVESQKWGGAAKRGQSADAPTGFIDQIPGWG